MNPSSIEDTINRLPCWLGRIEIQALDGGMTNHNYRVRDGAANYVVRLGDDLPAHGVMRFNELAAARAAHAAGISPEVVFAQPGIMVSRFIEGRTLTDQDVRDPRLSAPLVDLVRRCHQDVPQYLRGPVLMFWVFQVIRNYAALLRESPHNPLSARLGELLEMATKLEQAIGPISVVFGHNDLLAANFIDDGKRLWLLDWDYAGFNSPLFDLANLSSNNGYTHAQDEDLLERYFQTPPNAALRRAFVSMKCASLLREVLWGSVQQIQSTIAFDYPSYTAAYLARWDAMVVDLTTP